MESLSNPVAMAVRPKLPPGRTRRLELGEEERLLAACAMERGEIVGLRWEDVDIRASIARLNDIKNKRSRTVPFPER